jgi:hypothetical protein
MKPHYKVKVSMVHGIQGWEAYYSRSDRVPMRVVSYIPIENYWSRLGHLFVGVH